MHAETRAVEKKLQEEIGHLRGSLDKKSEDLRKEWRQELMEEVTSTQRIITSNTTNLSENLNRINNEICCEKKSTKDETQKRNLANI